MCFVPPAVYSTHTLVLLPIDDRFFDTLSMCTCHGHPLSCNTATGKWVSEANTAAVFAISDFEYECVPSACPSLLLGSGGPSPPSSVLHPPLCHCPSTSSLLVWECHCIYLSQGDVGIGPPSLSPSVRPPRSSGCNPLPCMDYLSSLSARLS